MNVRKLRLRPMPAQRTVQRLLDRAYLQRRRRRLDDPSNITPLPPPPVAPVKDLWVADFKNWWRAEDGRRCDLLTVRDGRSRAVLAVRVLDRANGDEVRKVFEALLARHGWPDAIQVNNDGPCVELKPAALRVEVRV